MKLEGNKTYIVASLLVILSIVNHVFDLPEDIYNTCRDMLNYLLYGTVGHKLIRTIKNK